MFKRFIATRIVVSFCVLLSLTGCFDQGVDSIFQSKFTTGEYVIPGPAPRLNPHLTAAEDTELLKTELMIMASQPWDPISPVSLIPQYRFMDGYSIIQGTPVHNHMTRPYVEDLRWRKRHNKDLADWEKDYDTADYIRRSLIEFQENADAKVKFFVSMDLENDNVAYRAGETYEFPIKIKRIEAMVRHDSPTGVNVQSLMPRSHVPQHLQAEKEVVYLNVYCKLLWYHHEKFGKSAAVE